MKSNFCVGSSLLFQDVLNLVIWHQKIPISIAKRSFVKHIYNKVIKEKKEKKLYFILLIILRKENASDCIKYTSYIQIKKKIKK